MSTSIPATIARERIRASAEATSMTNGATPLMKNRSTKTGLTKDTANAIPTGRTSAATSSAQYQRGRRLGAARSRMAATTAMDESAV